MSLSHTAFRRLEEQAFAELAGRPGTVAELQAAHAVSMVEGFGNWKPPGTGSHNYFAVQTRRGAGPCFSYVDHHENGAPYVACFKRYPSPFAGIKDGLDVLYFRAAARREGVLEGAASGSALEFARRQRASGYFELAASKYARGLAQHSATLARVLDEPQALRARSSSAGAGFALAGLGALAVLAWRGTHSRLALAAVAVPP